MEEELRSFDDRSWRCVIFHSRVCAWVFVFVVSITKQIMLRIFFLTQTPPPPPFLSHCLPYRVGVILVHPNRGNRGVSGLRADASQGPTHPLP